MEVTYCKTRKKSYIHFAARFAAKEAVAKSDAHRLERLAFHWRVFEVVERSVRRTAHSACREKLQKLLEQYNVHLSLSHTRQQWLRLWYWKAKNKKYSSFNYLLHNLY